MESKEKHHASTEEIILKAAEEEFFTKGYAGARTVSIAEKAGVTHALLHYYFRTKEQLFDRILKEKTDILSDSVLSVFGDESLPLFERIENGVRSHFELLSTMPNMPLFIINEMSRADDGWFEMMRRHISDKISLMLSNLQKDLDEAASAGECVKIPALMLILDIMSLNVFAFLSFPILDFIPGNPLSQREYLSRRMEENVAIILKRLKP